MNKKSFTLIELLIVIAIIAIIAVGIIILTIPGQRLAQARDATRASHLKNLETALYLYSLDEGFYPSGVIDELIEICNTNLEVYNCDDLVDLSSLDITIPVDPLGGDSIYGTGYYVVLENNKIVLYSLKSETKININIGGIDGFIPVYDWHSLNNIRNNLSSNYVLVNNLNSTTRGYDDYNIGDGWLPIGDEENPFEGIFNGKNYTISGLYIDRPNLDYVGLFGYINEGTIQGLGLVNFNIIGDVYVGGLAGIIVKGTIYNSYSNGVISGDIVVGGLAGFNDEGNILNSFNQASVSGNGYMGGITGGNFGGIISDSYNNGEISGIHDVAGIAGYSWGDIMIPHPEHGGESQTYEAYILNSYNTGNIFGEEYVGGVVGYNGGSVSTISDSYNIGEISGVNYVGGVVGETSYSELYNLTNTGNVSGEEYIGGIIGYKTGMSSDLHNTGNVSGVNYVGGIVGYKQSGYVLGGYNTGNISGVNYIAGIVGYSQQGWDDSISYFYNSGEISGNDYVAGIIGYNNLGDVFFSYNIGNVSGNDYVGGVAGFSYYHSLSGEKKISNNYNKGNISGDNYVGGIVGYNEYNEAGSGDMIVINSYNTGNISGNNHIGGVAGFSIGSVISSFWLQGSASTSDGGIMKTEIEMKNITIYNDADWDIIEIQNHNDEDWYINNNNDYPKLGWQ